jgi:hypothetical protein
MSGLDALLCCFLQPLHSRLELQKTEFLLDRSWQWLARQGALQLLNNC